MKKANLFERFVWFASRLFTSKRKQEENSDKAKREMCARAIKGGVCPKACEICAWNTLKGGEE